MTYSQSFKGSLRFADAHCLEAGLDALAGYDDAKEANAIRVDDCKIDGLGLRLDYDNMLPASMSFGTCRALRLLAEHAQSGTIRARYEGESPETIRAGGRRDDRGLPPRHHRWDVYFAARTGSAKALRALRAQGVDLVVRYASPWGTETALSLAAGSGSVSAVRVILEAGAKPDTDALVAAKNRAVAQVLLDAGAKPSALEEVCRKGNAEVALAVIDAGAKIPTKKSALVQLLRAIVGTGSMELLQAVAKHERARRALAAPEVIEVAIDQRKKRIEAFLIQHGAKRPEPRPERPDPHEVKIRASKGWNEGRYAESLALVRSIEDEDDADVYGLKGACLESLGRPAAAIAAFEKALKREPDNAVWRNCLAFSLASRGRTRDATTHYERALAQVETELAAEPDDASLWSRKAYSLNGLGRSDAALAAAKRAIDLEDDHTLALLNAGRALLDTQRPEEAREMLERAVTSDPPLPEPKYYLAIARARCGDHDGAKRVLAEVVAVSPQWKAMAKKQPSLAALVR
jgi:tetratricopeptide (TPR) repeat protein